MRLPIVGIDAPRLDARDRVRHCGVAITSAACASVSTAGLARIWLMPCPVLAAGVADLDHEVSELAADRQAPGLRVRVHRVLGRVGVGVRRAEDRRAALGEQVRVDVLHAGREDVGHGDARVVRAVDGQQVVEEHVVAHPEPAADDGLAVADQAVARARRPVEAEARARSCSCPSRPVPAPSPRGSPGRSRRTSRAERSRTRSAGRGSASGPE